MFALSSSISSILDASAKRKSFYSSYCEELPALNVYPVSLRIAWISGVGASTKTIICWIREIFCINQFLKLLKIVTKKFIDRFTAGPIKNVINNAYSTARRPFNKITTANNSNFTKKVNTVKETRVNTARPKAVISVVKGNKGNPQQDLKNKRVIDSRSSRHMTGNRSYLTDYEEIDRGFVAFGGNSKGGKITGKDNTFHDDSEKVAFDLLRDALSAIFGLSELKDCEREYSKEFSQAGFKPSGEEKRRMLKIQGMKIVSSTVNAAVIEVNAIDLKTSIKLPNDLNMPELEDIVYSNDDDDLFTRRTQEDNPSIKESSWIEAMQDELLQFKLQKVWTLVDLPNGKRAIGPKWVYKNKNDERGIMIKNKSRLVAEGYTQEEGIDYDKVFAPVAIIEAIRLFLAYASFKDFVVYQMDVNSAFLYGKIE
ncbi:putative ribonuclease H-like domain-containing protein [Tanacetum coccineum]